MQSLKITDTLSSNVTYFDTNMSSSNLHVYLDNRELTEGTEYTVDVATGCVTFLVAVPKGSLAKVTFDVNIDPACQDLLANSTTGTGTYPTNTTATATATCSGKDYNGTYNVPDVTVTGTTLTMTKVSADDASQKLTGAQFKLVRTEGNVEKTFTTGNNGTVNLQYLPHGTYTLTETQAPDGYLISAEPVTFTVGTDNSTITPEPDSGTGFTWQKDSEGKVTGLTVTNTRNTTTLTITKKVTGSTASAVAPFSFNGTFKKGNDNATNVSYRINNGDTQTISDGAGTFSLKAGDTIVITLPVGVTYAINETADSAAGYTTTIEATPTDKVTVTSSERKISGTTEADVAVSAIYTNDSTFVPSALTTNNLPFMLLIAGAGILGLALVIRKRTGKTKSGF